MVLITGGVGGIGRAIARVFAASSDKAVVVVDRNRPAPAEAAARVRYLTADVCNRGELARVLEQVSEVDVLVCCAGIQRHGLVGDQPVSEWREVIDVNLAGVYHTVDELVGRMAAGGAIVFIGSVAGSLGFAGRAAYSTAKAGLNGLMRSLAVELAPRGIRVNVVSPGFTRTAMIEQRLQSGALDLDSMLAAVPLARLAEPEDVAAAVSFLASDAAAFITGQDLAVDGGFSSRGLSEPPNERLMAESRRQTIELC